MINQRFLQVPLFIVLASQGAWAADCVDLSGVYEFKRRPGCISSVEVPDDYEGKVLNILTSHHRGSTMSGIALGEEQLLIVQEGCSKISLGTQRWVGEGNDRQEYLRRPREIPAPVSGVWPEEDDGFSTRTRWTHSWKLGSSFTTRLVRRDRDQSTVETEELLLNADRDLVVKSFGERRWARPNRGDPRNESFAETCILKRVADRYVPSPQEQARLDEENREREQETQQRQEALQQARAELAHLRETYTTKIATCKNIERRLFQECDARDCPPLDPESLIVRVYARSIPVQGEVLYTVEHAVNTDGTEIQLYETALTNHTRRGFVIEQSSHDGVQVISRFEPGRARRVVLGIDLDVEGYGPFRCDIERLK